ncbi:hypothetical protein SO802_017486 [Lithocarpus litseifolius]|uniref:Uncharacterized protein n=1 Tax=Lithocarpus litseifolius TaxID=425828 RepID=A0AAW2CII2_9ROSI
MVIDDLDATDMGLDPWAGCKGYVECEWVLELNKCQVLFVCGHGRYKYLRDRVLPQVHHIYPLEVIPIHPCPSIRLANLLTEEEVANARVGRTNLGILEDYLEFTKAHL